MKDPTEVLLSLRRSVVLARLEAEGLSRKWMFLQFQRRGYKVSSSSFYAAFSGKRSGNTACFVIVTAEDILDEYAKAFGKEVSGE